MSPFSLSLFITSSETSRAFCPFYFSFLFLFSRGHVVLASKRVSIYSRGRICIDFSSCRERKGKRCQCTHTLNLFSLSSRLSWLEEDERVLSFLLRLPASMLFVEGGGNLQSEKEKKSDTEHSPVRLPLSKMYDCCVRAPTKNMSAL